MYSLHPLKNGEKYRMNFDLPNGPHYALLSHRYMCSIIFLKMCWVL